MRQVTLLKIFIASPGDTKQQREEVEEIILKWNRDYTDSRGIILMPVKWEYDSTSSYNDNMSGQQVINNQLLLDSDILIALFNMKLGTPVDEYKSGTVEEIEIFYQQNGDHTGIFFNNVTHIPQEKFSEYTKLMDYKEELINKRKGLFATYSSDTIRRYLEIEIDKKIKKSILTENDSSSIPFSNNLSTKVTESKEKLDNLIDDGSINKIWLDDLTVPDNLKNLFLLIDSRKGFTKDKLKTVSGKRYIYSFDKPVHPKGNAFVNPKKLYLPVANKDIYFESNYSAYQGKKVGQRLVNELNVVI